MYRYNKQYFSIVSQGVAGPNYKLITTEVRAYGKESDSGIVFRIPVFPKTLKKQWMSEDKAHYEEQILQYLTFLLFNIHSRKTGYLAH
jgi:hypothetical protein